MNLVEVTSKGRKLVCVGREEAEDAQTILRGHSDDSVSDKLLEGSLLGELLKGRVTGKTDISISGHEAATVDVEQYRVGLRGADLKEFLAFRPTVGA